MGRAPGVSEPSELKAFVDAAGPALLVVDLREPDCANGKEPGDCKQKEVAPIAGPSRKAALNLVFNRADSTLDVAPLDGKAKDTPIIVHCGIGIRAQKGKGILETHGFTNVKNGGGPEDAECWAVYGHL